MDEIESIAKTYKSDKGKMYDYIQHGITRFENNSNTNEKLKCDARKLKSAFENSV
jgi:hypothetical protein